MREIGSVEVVRRYPVKSMLGERVVQVHVDERGLAGDRVHAVVDEANQRIATAKHPRLWRRLLACTATTGRDGVVVRLPEGRQHRADDPDLHEVLSELLGRAVTLRSVPPPGAELDRSVPEEVLDRGVDAEVDATVLPLAQGAPPGAFVDYAPVHVISTTTVQRVSELAGEGVDHRRYRPNLVLRTDIPGFGENGWVGRVLRVGAEVELRVVMPTPRCAVPTLEHGASQRQPEALRAVAAGNRVPVEGFGEQPCAGVYARVLRGGQVRAGDVLRLVDAAPPG